MVVILLLVWAAIPVVEFELDFLTRMVLMGLAMLLGLSILWSERGRGLKAGDEKRVDALRRDWYALSLFAFLLLMPFEVTMMIASETVWSGTGELLPVVCVGSGIYVLYLLLTTWAHVCLRSLVALQVQPRYSPTH